MSLAEDLLNTLNDDSSSVSTETNDVEEPIIIDETRRIIVPDKLKTIAVKGDKDVETATIKCIRYWDTIHDLSTFTIYINYTLPNGDTGTYLPFNIVTYDDCFTFDWVIGREITKYNGTLSFSIVATKVDDEGVLEYQWGSFINSDCVIANGNDVVNIPDNEENKDALALLIQGIDDALDEILSLQKILIEEGNTEAGWIIDLFYPIGSIYMSVNEVSPSVMFGGTWKRLSNAFLLGAGDKYTLGETGGEATHLLTIDEMPTHYHNLLNNATAFADPANDQAYTWGNEYSRAQAFVNRTENVGGGQPHNNMPPYLTVNMWKRVA